LCFIQIADAINSFEFARTASRLNEMQSEAYLEASQAAGAAASLDPV
jgi:predicted ATPase